jgi:chromosome segregation ATPase
MTLSPETALEDVLADIRQAQLAQAEELKVIKGQLTDLPGLSSRMAGTRLDLRHDVRELRDQVAELPGIRTRLEDQDRQLAEIKEQLATILSLLQP